MLLINLCGGFRQWVIHDGNQWLLGVMVVGSLSFGWWQIWILWLDCGGWWLARDVYGWLVWWWQRVFCGFAGLFALYLEERERDEEE